jgi:hypothetical protein
VKERIITDKGVLDILQRPASTDTFCESRIVLAAYTRHRKIHGIPWNEVQLLTFWTSPNRVKVIAIASIPGYDMFCWIKCLPTCAGKQPLHVSSFNKGLAIAGWTADKTQF